MPNIQRAAPVRPPAPPPVVQPEPLYVFLKPEIDQGLVTVLGDHAMPIVRIRNTGLFPSGSATVSPRLHLTAATHRRGAEGEKGPVDVIGYTDNQPIHTVQFPSNLPVVQGAGRGGERHHRPALGDPGPRHRRRARRRRSGRIRTPRPQGRDENRRIEVTLRRQG